MNSTRLKPVAQRTLSDEVTDRLRTAIRDGALQPGARLVEQELAEFLAVSRIPVREAIQRLVEEGLVHKTPHRGAYVYLPSASEIEEISSLRVVLERFVVERVLARWRPENEAGLQAIVAAMHHAAEQGNSQQVYELDYRFHHTLWKIADHSIMLEVVSSMRARISRFLYEATNVLSPNELSTHVDGHDVLIAILKSGDVAAAQAGITQHILGAKNRVLTYCKLAPDSAETDRAPANDGGTKSV